jgi:hypothetical protein
MMKKTNQQTFKNTKRKLAIIIATLTAGLFTLISQSSIVHANELVKSEPITEISLYQEAQESLALSFTNLSLTQNINNELMKNSIIDQVNPTSAINVITLTNVILESE